MSNASNESPAHLPNKLPLSPSVYYNSIPLTAQLSLDVAREILCKATIRHEEEPLPVSPRTGVNVLHNSNCTTQDAIEVAEGLTATIKNWESFHISASYSSRNRSPDSDNGSTNNQIATTPTTNAPTSWQHQSGSPSMLGTS